MRTININTNTNSKRAMKHFSFFIFLFAFALASCSKEELPTTGGQNAEGTYTFSLGIEEPDYAPKSRATVAMDRYVMEIYEGDLSATPVKMTNTTGVFSVEMKKKTDYVCLFWADNGTTYNVESLKAVKQADESSLGTAAYFANIKINTENFNGAITLKRAVAELSFIDQGGWLYQTRNTLQVTYPYASATFNLGDGTVVYAPGSAVRTIAKIARPTVATNAFASDFVLAPTAVGSFAGLKVQLNAETEITVVTTAIQANFKTKITGKYQLKPIPATTAAVGDFYMNDGFCLPAATTLSAVQQANCIGIVYFVNPDGKTGKIVGLTETTAPWSTEYIDTGAFRDADGAGNTAAVLTLTSYSGTTYPAFAWCAAKNTPAIAGIKWYIPAKEELLALYGTKTVVNTSLAAAGATQFSDNKHYWSSTQDNDNGAWRVYFGNGITTSYDKGSLNSVRVVSAF